MTGELVSPVLHQYWWLEIVPDVAPVLVTGDCPRCCTSISDWRLSQMLHQYWWLEIVPDVAPVLVTEDCPPYCTSIGDWRLSRMLHQYWWLEIVPDVAPVLVALDCPPCCTSIQERSALWVWSSKLPPSVSYQCSVQGSGAHPSKQHYESPWDPPNTDSTATRFQKGHWFKTELLELSDSWLPTWRRAYKLMLSWWTLQKPLAKWATVFLSIGLTITA